MRILASLALLVVSATFAPASPIVMRTPWADGDWWQPSTYDEHISAGRDCATDFNAVSASSVSPNWPYGSEVNDAGRAILAAHAGRVTTVAEASSGGYGNLVKLTSSEDGDYATWYGHLSSFAVSNGAAVQMGDVIGYCGATGIASGTHLHFELRRKGVAQSTSTFDLSGQVITIDYSKMDSIGRYRGYPLQGKSSCNSNPLDLWVQIGGAGSDCGTFDNPLKNLYTALAKAANNGTITIKLGGALGTGTLDPGGKTVTLQPQPGQAVTLGP